MTGDHVAMISPEIDALMRRRQEQAERVVEATKHDDRLTLVRLLLSHLPIDYVDNTVLPLLEKD